MSKLPIALRKRLLAYVLSNLCAPLLCYLRTISAGPKLLVVHQVMKSVSRLAIASTLANSVASVRGVAISQISRKPPVNEASYFHSISSHLSPHVLSHHIPAHSTLNVLILTSFLSLSPPALAPAGCSPPTNHPFLTPVPSRPPPTISIRSISSSQSTLTARKWL